MKLRSFTLKGTSTPSWYKCPEDKRSIKFGVPATLLNNGEVKKSS
ncbi:hypothetical protein ES703_15270 [subsurface metagenome]